MFKKKLNTFKCFKIFFLSLAKATAAQKQAIRTQYKPPAPSKSRTKVPSGQSSGYGKATTPSRYSQQALQNQYQNQK